MAEVMSFHIVYEGLEDLLWRDVEVSSKYRLDQLGYLVLATFDTMAYHLFQIQLRGKVYSLPGEDNPPEFNDMAAFTLGSLSLTIGETMDLLYDFGTEQHFVMTLTAVREMKRGTGTHYPWITAMHGKGIIDDMSPDELAALVRQTQKNGKTDEPVYYLKSRSFSMVPWDYNRFNLKSENILLKGEIELAARNYMQFWESY